MLVSKSYPDKQRILYLEGQLNYTYIHLNNGRFVVSANTLLDHERKLGGFVRISKKHLVNPAKVLGLTSNIEVQLREGTCLCVSRRKKKLVKSIFHKIKPL